MHRTVPYLAHSSSKSVSPTIAAENGHSGPFSATERCGIKQSPDKVQPKGRESFSNEVIVRRNGRGFQVTQSLEEILCVHSQDRQRKRL